MTDPEDLTEVAVVFRSIDGGELTAQSMLDAFSDALIVNDNVPCPVEPEEKYDS